MKTKKLLTALVLVMAVTGTAHASEDFTDDSNWDIAPLGVTGNEKVDAGDPCTVAFCLYGELVGQSGGKACRAPIKKFFSIAKFGKHGFDPSKTLKKRKGFLGGCPSLDSGIQKKLLSKFGKLRGL
ncbi:arginine transporter [Salmonella enterica]|uniref:arginine transporter n=1 Tax=Klebsiella pneumoniae TaxID=573 RepID=UPI0010353424|nr:arginine transporter [Klebsiella pneumoniae]EBJ5156723.1 arginine transporter [Salmonella enterica]EET1434532.1 arginine transporter [Escherichia coli]EBM6019343.1 arginine transporter [Salmonella enterica]EFM5365733.1 arginine transporter [Escherichia coli]EGH5609869.1 arginine transporter [Escherichia coli]